MNLRHAPLLLLLASGAATASAQTQAPAAQPTPEIPYAQNPNVPGLSRDERIKRQDALIRAKMQDNEQKKREGQVKQLEQKVKEVKGDPKNPAATPGPNLLPQGAGTPVPIKPNDPNLNLSKVKGQQPGSNVWVAKIKDRDTKELGFRQVALYLYPASLAVTSGEKFSTEVRLLSLDKSPANRIKVFVSYPVGVVEPVGIHQNVLKPLLAYDANWGIDKEAGVLRYEARLKEPLSTLDSQVLEIEWKALKPADEVALTLKSPARFSAALYDDVILTESEFGKAGALVGSFVRILRPRGDVPEGSRMAIGPLADAATANPKLQGSLRAAPPLLWLDYPHKDVYQEDEWVPVDVILDNRQKASFDEVRLALAFDPEAVEIADTDTRNMIRQGVNILDGPFREQWGWENLIENKVNNEAGLIEYRMATKDIHPRSSGVLVRIFVHVKQETFDPLLTWVWDEAAFPGRATNVLCLGRGLYPRPGSPQTALAEKADPAIYRHE